MLAAQVHLDGALIIVELHASLLQATQPVTLLTATQLGGSLASVQLPANAPAGATCAINGNRLQYMPPSNNHVSAAHATSRQAQLLWSALAALATTWLAARMCG